MIASPESEAEASLQNAMPVQSLFDVQAVRNYLNRVNARPRSMFTAVVSDQEGQYSRDVATIHLDKKTGEIEVQGEDTEAYAPNDLERQAIRAEFPSVRFPAPKRLHRIINPDPLIRNAAPGNLFEFRDAGGQIVMLQVRVASEDGSKDYKPLTYFDDGKWRVCEPGGPLPLYNAEKLGSSTTIFLHEGAKAARHVQSMAEEADREAKKALAEHPWGQQLVGAVHLGWIGGAPNPHRSDWSMLAKRGVKFIYIVADNDEAGEAVIASISRLLKDEPITVMAVRFDKRFKGGFDLADPFPAEMFRKLPDGSMSYAGPTFLDCVRPATWATKVVQEDPETKRPSTTRVYLRQEFLRTWFMVAGPTKSMFIAAHDRTKFYSAEAFDKAVRPFSDVKRTSDLFAQQGYTAHVEAVAYEPGLAEGCLNIQGERCLNTWVASRIRPAAGDPTAWLEFMAQLFPVPEDCKLVLKWCATLIACPQVRMRYALLLSSKAQGVGKTTFCETLRVLVGEKNCGVPSVHSVVGSDFNSWIVRKRLVFVNEIYEGQSWSAYNKLKTFITDETLTANEKFVPQYEIKNQAHFVLCSNADVALRVADEDRRLLVPQVTETKRPGTFWRDLHTWLDSGGYSIIAHWAADYVGEYGHVQTHEDAPETARKQALIEDSRSQEEQLVRTLAEAAQERAEKCQRPVGVVVQVVVEWLKQQQGKAMPPDTVRRWLGEAGLHTTENRGVKVNGRATSLASTQALPPRPKWSEVKERVAWLKPWELVPISL